MYISRVKIKNFRSLVDVDVHFVGYNALVGLNDAGKSNLLRALNLFFNGETDLGSRFVFSSDFSQLAKVIGKKAKEVEIEIEITPPTHYSDKGAVIWRKTFRADSEKAFTDVISKKDGSGFAKGSKVDFWVRNLAFEYVPAVRGRQFFANLKRRLYTALAATVATNLTGASGAFLSSVRTEVGKLESETVRLLGLQTEFSLPGDLGDLFEILDFEAGDKYTKTALTQRGDGIQGRHVPLILKFLADQRKKNASKGKPAIETIWGFEEPENNLELLKQIEAALEFKTYSQTIQIILSSHSPAFYGAAKANGKVWIASRVHGLTKFVDSVSSEQLDEHLGLMHFVHPYLSQAVSDRERLIASIKSLEETALVRNKAAVYVEGVSDKTILEAALKALGFDVSFEIVANPLGLSGGVNWVKSYCVARAAITDLKEKTAALFDSDEAGKAAATELTEQLNAIGRQGRVKCFTVGRETGQDAVRAIKKSGLNISFSIEELCGVSAWRHADSRGWLIERGNSLILDNANLLDKDTALTHKIESMFTDADIKKMIYFKVDHFKKTEFSKFVASTMLAKSDVPESLKVLVESICSYFRPKQMDLL
jgi:AAA ATPase domain